MSDRETRHLDEHGHPDDSDRYPQPDPTPTNGAHIHDLVAWDLAMRKQQGIRTYGQPLQAGNGRDALWDAYEEALDLACYLRQAIAERGLDE